jgi:hypothetical protein
VTVRLIAACALAAALAACGARAATTPPEVPARLEEEFRLRPGQTADIENEPLAVTFTGVPQDSRCPAGVQCVRAGEATVRLQLRLPQRDTSVVLATPIEPHGATFGGYQVWLARLDPLPTAAGRPAVYTATLRVQKP